MIPRHQSTTTNNVRVTWHSSINSKETRRRENLARSASSVTRDPFNISSSSSTISLALNYPSSPSTLFSSQTETLTIQSFWDILYFDTRLLEIYLATLEVVLRKQNKNSTLKTNTLLYYSPHLVLFLCPRAPYILTYLERYWFCVFIWASSRTTTQLYLFIPFSTIKLRSDWTVAFSCGQSENGGH